MRMLAAFLVLVLVSFVAMSGCATIEENPRTAIGAVVGGADRRPRRRADATDRLAVSVEVHVTVRARLTEQRSLLEQPAHRLLAREGVERDEVQALLAGAKLS